MRFNLVVLFATVFTCGISNAASTVNFYTCPKLSPQKNSHQQVLFQRAISISLFDGHPSELAQLKPDNADTDDTGPAYWILGASERAYWYVCNYENGQLSYKLPKKYAKCVNLGNAKNQDSLKCK